MTADVAIRIVLLTLQGCTATHMQLSLTAGISSPFKRVSARIISTTFTSQPTQSPMETTIWARFHIVNPIGLPMWSHKMCAGSQAGLNSRSSTSQTVSQTYQNSALMRLIELRRRELVG